MRRNMKSHALLQVQSDEISRLSAELADTKTKLAEALDALNRISDSDAFTGWGHLRDIANEVRHNTDATGDK